MKASELRIGNLIEWKGIVSTIIVTNIYGNPSISVKYDNSIEGQKFTMIETVLLDYSEHKKLYKPIPLTEEWLVRLGFIVTEYFIRKDCGNNKLGISLNRTDFGLPIYNSNGDYIYTIEIKFIHQLQNIYIALTGEELVY